MIKRVMVAENTESTSVDSLYMLDCQISDVLQAGNAAQNLHDDAGDNDLLAQCSELLRQRKALLTKLVPGENITEVQWQQAIERTQQIITQFAEQREKSRLQLQQIQRGQRSVQQYNKFR